MHKHEPRLPNDADESTPRRIAAACCWVAVILFVLGIGFRIAPMLDHGDRLMWQWPTEDGYLMKTIARNLAIGSGFTVSDGEIATNGTQPLTTFIWAGFFKVSGGEREAAVLMIQVFQLCVSLLCAGLLFLVLRRLIPSSPWFTAAAALTCGFWFASPVMINFTMNGLETGNYVAMILLSLLVWLRGEQSTDRRWPWFAIGLGVLLGLTFLTRIDAVFFIGAVTLWHVLLGLREERRELARRFGESVVMGLTSIAIASPWLIYNKVYFGSLMPVSGTAQSAAAAFGSNAAKLPAVLFEYITIVLPIPSGLMATGAVVVIASTFVLGYFIACILLARHMSSEQLSVLCIGAMFITGLAAYYGLFFGASHFLSRYLFPATPWLVAMTIAVVLSILYRLAPRWSLVRVPAGIAALLAMVLVVGLNVRTYVNIGRGSAYDHIQIVQWVEENLPEDAWAGAVQTGVLGFFHDRTINLDGKVNPEALEAKLKQRIPHYVVESPIDVLADWAGIAGWIELEPLDRTFEVVVEDRSRNLAVLRRQQPIAASLRERVEQMGRRAGDGVTASVQPQLGGE